MNNSELQTDQVSTIAFTYQDNLPLSFVMDFILEHKALDVYAVPVSRKGSQAFEVYLLCLQEQEAYFTRLVTENFTNDLRVTRQHRYKLWREFIQVEIANSLVQVKCGYTLKNGKKRYLQVMPEYEDCKRLAQSLNRPVQEIYEKARLLATSP